jgi:putative ABC transport system permease protein
VAGDVRNKGLAHPPGPEFYLVRATAGRGIPGSSDPAWPRRGTAIYRTTIPEAAAAESLRSAIQQLDPALPVKIETMRDEVDRFLPRPRFQTVVLTLFALTGLVLASIGLYGLISYLVQGRTREIAVRIALGATRGNVLRMVLSDAGYWTLAGVLLGSAASAASLGFFQSLLYDVPALDVRAFAAALFALGSVAALAAWIPARRASKIDPAAALRQE